MKTLRFLSIFGPAAVLYTALSVLVQQTFSFGEWLVVCLALGLSATPLWLRSRGITDQGGRRVGLLGVALGLWLASLLGHSLVLEYIRMLSVTVVGLVALDLAGIAMPRTPKVVLMRAAVMVSGVLCLLLGWWAIAAPISIKGELVLVPTARWAPLPEVFALVAILIAFVVRIDDGRRAERDIGTHAWPIAGLCAAAITMVASWIAGGSLVGASAAAAAVLLCGHLWFITGGGKLAAGSFLHRALSFGLGAVFLFGIVYFLPRQDWRDGIVAVGVFVAGVLLYRSAYVLLRRAFAPDGGKLIRSIERAARGVHGGVTLAESAERVLIPFRVRGDAARPALVVLDPACALELDVSGKARQRERPFPGPILDAVRFAEGPVIELATLEQQVVRQPRVRPLVEAMQREELQWAVPCMHEGSPEGALLLPQSGKARRLIAAEVAAFARLGAKTGSVLSLVSGRERAEHRYAHSRKDYRTALEKTEALENELARLRDQYGALVAGRHAEDEAGLQVGYSAAMRTVARRAEDIAALDGPVTVVAGAGAPVTPLVRFIHERSNRSDGPLVIADCAAIAPEAASRLLFGTAEGSQLGWLRHAEGGTLVLRDLPALPLEAQRSLRNAFAERQATVAEGLETYRINARIVATSRLPIETLTATGGIDGELARWLSALTLSVPPLRHRKEDLPSLTLLAIHRACRVLGRPEVGIEHAAMERLLTHSWPGDVAELLGVIEQAVAAASGNQIKSSALPEFGAIAPSDAGLSGTYIEVERRLLERALDRAGGNKSEAARSLGLKRTTFLDKLRRHGLDKGPSVRVLRSS